MKKSEILDWAKNNIIGIDFSFDPKSRECFVIWGNEYGVSETYGRNLKEAITTAMAEQESLTANYMVWM